MHSGRILAVFSLLLTSSLGAQSPSRVPDLIRGMTLEEKFWQLFMIPGSLDDRSHDYANGIFGLQVPAAPTARADAERINAIQRHFAERTRLRIPMIPWEEAVHGLRRPGATMFPQAIGLAATFDTALMGRIATAIARETGSRGIRMVLSPVVNIASDVRWGRVEETYGEDPLLSSEMARAFVTPLERAGIITTPKHFVANVGDGGRDSYPIMWNERELAELHYPPFRAALAAGSRSIMTAYNSVDGRPATQNRRLLTDVLRRDWRFGGFVISDMSATGGATVLHLTQPNTPTAASNAFAAGLDVVLQSSWPEHRPYLDAFRRNLIPAAVIDSSLARVLRAKEQLGLFERPYADPDSAEYWNGHLDHQALAREAADASVVLLKNDSLLPLVRQGPVAIIGMDAIEARFGGYSDRGVSPVTIASGLRDRLRGRQVAIVPGPGREFESFVTVPTGRFQGTVSFFNNPGLQGTATQSRRDSLIDARWTFNRPASGLGTDWYSVRWEGTLTAGHRAIRRLGVEGTDGWRLYLNDTLRLDRWHKRSAGTHLIPVTMPAGGSQRLRLEYFETTGNARVRLIWDDGASDIRRERLDTAVSVARRSAIAIVVAGIEEGEFRDRAFLGLPGLQEELIRRVAEATPTIVILVGGSAITMPWLDRVAAVLMAWYPGEQGGRAIADIVMGSVSPSGRLPITFPLAEGQLPLVYNHRPTGRGDDYLDLTGRPLFPFGHGLSYAVFEYSNLVVTAERVTFRVRNMSQYLADEVPQVYIRDMLASVARPVLQLAGFTRVRLRPGEFRDVTLPLGPERLGMLNADLQWVVEPGTFRVYVGASSRDIRLRGEIVVP